MRYNYQPTRMLRDTSASLVAVDQVVDLALCIVNVDSKGEEILAVGRYYYIASNNEAEVAFVVRPDNQAMKKVLEHYDVSIRNCNEDGELILALNLKD